jgi:glutaredoxin 3
MASADDAVAAVTDVHSLVVFSDSTCPYCKQIVRAFDAVNVQAHVVEAKPSLRSTLKSKTGQSSVPSVWVGDKFIGGCNDGPQEWMGALPNLRNG